MKGHQSAGQGGGRLRDEPKERLLQKQKSEIRLCLQAINSINKAFSILTDCALFVNLMKLKMNLTRLSYVLH